MISAGKTKAGRRIPYDDVKGRFADYMCGLASFKDKHRMKVGIRKKYLNKVCHAKVSNEYKNERKGLKGIQKDIYKVIARKFLIEARDIVINTLSKKWWDPRRKRIVNNPRRTRGLQKFGIVDIHAKVPHFNRMMYDFVTGAKRVGHISIGKDKWYENLRIFANPADKNEMYGLKLARLLALMGIEPDKVIFLPKTIRMERDLIIKVFPKGWQRNHLIERMARLYLTTIKELDTNKDDVEKIDHDKAAKQVVLQVRRLAKKAIDNRAVLPTLKVDDTTAEANYKTIANNATGVFMPRFLWDLTDTFVLKAEQKNVGTPPKLVVDITFRNATAIKDAIGKPKSHSLSTHELRRISKNTAIRSRFRLKEKIMQADTIRDQMVIAKHFYSKKAGHAVASSKGSYAKNRDAQDKKIVDMVIATIKGMKKTFKEHFAKDGAADITLSELQARGVVLKKGAAKDPDYVKFEISLHKGTTVVDPIVNGHRGNRTLRYAVAVRRYQDAKILLDKKFTDPKDRAAKLPKMIATLNAKLKGLSDDDLLRSAVDGIADDGSVKIKLAPKVFIKYAKTGWLGKQRKAMEGLGNIRRPKANEGADSYVDIIDRSKFIFKQIIDSNKSKLQDKGGRLDPKKLQALAEALVDLIRKMQKNPKGDRTGTRWLHTGKGGTFEIKPGMVKKYYKKPVKDVNGRTIGHRWRSRMVPGYKVTDLKLPNRFKGEGGPEGEIFRTNFLGGTFRVMGSLLAFGLGVGDFKDGTLLLAGKLKAEWEHKSGFFMGVQGGMYYIHGVPTKFNCWGEKCPVLRAPGHSIAQGFDAGGGFASVMAGYKYRGGNSELELSIDGGNVRMKPGMHKDFLDPSNGSLTYPGTPFANGALGNLSYTYKKEGFGTLSVKASGGYGKPANLSTKKAEQYADGAAGAVMAQIVYEMTGGKFNAGLTVAHNDQKGGTQLAPDGVHKVRNARQTSALITVGTKLWKRLTLDGGVRVVSQTYRDDVQPYNFTDISMFLAAEVSLGLGFSLFGVGSAVMPGSKWRVQLVEDNPMGDPIITTPEMPLKGGSFFFGLKYGRKNFKLSAGCGASNIGSDGVKAFTPFCGAMINVGE